MKTRKKLFVSLLLTALVAVFPITAFANPSKIADPEIVVDVSGPAADEQAVAVSAEQTKVHSDQLQVTETEKTDVKNLSGSSSWEVSFDAGNGSRITSKYADDGETVEKPEDPFRHGYVFAYWYRGTAIDEPFDFFAPVTENIELHARWYSVGWQYDKTVKAYTYRKADGTIVNYGFSLTLERRSILPRRSFFGGKL